MLSAQKICLHALLANIVSDQIMPIDPSELVLEGPTVHPLIHQVEVPGSNASLILEDALLGIDVTQDIPTTSPFSTGSPKHNVLSKFC